MYERFIEELRKHDLAVIIGHEKPDGDCLSSEIAAGYLLEKLGYETLLVNAGPFRDNESEEIRKLFVSDIPQEFLDRNPVLLVVDCSTLDRIGENLQHKVEGLVKFSIDHHVPDPDTHWDFIVDDPKSISTTIIIKHIFDEMEMPIPADIAEHLLFGFTTDSGYYHHIKDEDSQAMRDVADLMDCGASFSSIDIRMNTGKDWDSTMNIGKLVNRCERHFDRRIVFSYSLLRDNVSDPPSDMLYSMLLSIKGIEGVFFFKQKEDGRTVIGMRANKRSSLDVSAIAQSLGGGGHIKASGCTVDMTILEAMATIKKKLSQIL